MREPEFHRIRRLPPYVFAEVNQLKARHARRRAATSSTSAWATPTWPRRRTSSTSWSRRCSDPQAPTATRPRRGIPGLRRAQAGYYARRFGVKLDPETEVMRDARLQGGAGQPRAGDHRARATPCWCRTRAIRSTPTASSSPARAHPPRAARPAASTCMRELARAARALGADADRGGAELSRRTRRRRSATSTSTARSSPSRASTELWVLSDLAYAEIYFDGCRRPRSSRSPGAVEVGGRVQLALQDLLDAGLAHRLRRRQRAAGRRADPDQVLPRLRRLHPDPGGRRPPRSTARRTASRRSASIYRERRDVLVDGLAKAGWHDPAPAGHHVRLGAGARAVRGARARWASPSSCSRRPRSRSRPGIGFGEYGEGYVRLGAGRERAPAPPGGAQHPHLPGSGTATPSRRRRRRDREVA